MIDAFEAGFGKPGKSNPGTSLRAIVTGMPPLEAAMVDAVGKGTFEGFRASTDRQVAGDYDPDDKCIYIGAARLREAAKSETQADGVRYTLAHEIQHALDRDAIVDQDAAFRQGATRLIQSGSPRDYTTLLANYLQRSSEIEIAAEIAGFNAFADHVKTRKPNATLGDLDKASHQNMQMYVDVDRWSDTPYRPKQGLTIDGDLHIASTPENLSAMKRHYFDANRYHLVEFDRAFRVLREMEAQALATARSADPQCEAPSLLVDCARLGLRPGHLPEGFTDRQAKRDAPDPSAAQVPVVEPESDASHKKPRIMPAAPDGAAPMSAPAPLTPDRSGHPDHDFYTFLRGQLPGEVPDNAVAHAMSIAKSKGIVDASFVERGQVGFLPETRTIVIGGTMQVRQERVVLPVDSAQSMPLVAEELQAQRSRAAQSASGGSTEVAQVSSLQRH
ncbi:MAG: hypothetical protein ACOY82_10515 [Pseudomonadota bacterium]